MQDLFEYSDTLNSPIEAFIYDTSIHPCPMLSHWHYFVEIIYVLEGESKIICNGKTYYTKPGDVLFFHPQIVHAFYRHNTDNFKYSIVKFDLNKLPHPENYLSKFNSMILSSTDLPDLPIMFNQKDFDDFSLKCFFDNCVEEMQTKDFGYDSYLQYQISILLLRIIRIWRNHGLEPKKTTPVVKGNYTMNDILEYIDKHSSEKLLVDELAKLCHMSYSYFARQFRLLYGQSCKDYIEFIRLSKVENYLLFTDFDLNYISTETGFSDCSHLIRIFKRKYGITPKQYRTINQK